AKALNSESVPISELMGLASAHYQNGRLRKAGEIYERVLRLNPEQAEASCNLGLIAHREGHNDLARELISRAIAKDPLRSTFYLNLGVVLGSGDDIDQSIASYRKAIELDPGCVPAHVNLGNALLKKNIFPEAASSFAKALELSPKHHETINSLGVALERMGLHEKSIVCFRKALSLYPGYVEALSNLGFSLNAVGRRDEAAQSCETARDLRPDDPMVNLNLGNIYIGQGRLAEAAECFLRIIELDPLNGAAYDSLGLAYMEMGRLKEARNCFEKALEVSPNYANAYSNLLCFHASMRDISPEAEREFAEDWEKCALSGEERLAARTRASRKGGAFAARQRLGRKLRIGIVTAELGSHAVAEFLEPFIEHLDKQRFNLTFFPTVAWSGARTQRMVALGDGLVSLIGEPHAKAADRIRAEQIDILMDTTGHTANCHLGIFAHRAAPVQLTYLGYWSTTGLTEMDWILADPYLPSYCDEHFTEGMWRLPRLGACYRGDFSLPESCWEPGNTIYLGSFNRYHKIREQTLTLWARILQTLPEAKLLLEDRRTHETETRQRILTTLAMHGVAGDRVEFVPAIFDHGQHMVLYDRLDVALDTIPFNSGTTGFDALWMGVPLVALDGNWSGGRITSSVLRALGREEWIAQTEEDYVSIVRTLVEDVSHRKEIRKSQRARMAASPLCDAEGLARALEGAFEAMYDRWLEA
ncbi:MAG: tetratricopeptide repeat protein, partial [Terracidiphilus sp.]